MIATNNTTSCSIRCACGQCVTSDGHLVNTASRTCCCLIVSVDSPGGYVESVDDIVDELLDAIETPKLPETKCRDTYDAPTRHPMPVETIEVAAKLPDARARGPPRLTYGATGATSHRPPPPFSAGSKSGGKSRARIRQV